MDYTPSQIELIQEFVDTYRAQPEILTMGERFFGFPSVSNQKRADLEALVDRGDIEIKAQDGPPETAKLGFSTFYRLSDNFDLKTLIGKGLIVIR